MTKNAVGACCALATLLLSISAGAALAAQPPKLAEETLDGKIVTPAGTFDSWSEYAASDYFERNGLRCATSISGGGEFADPSDCTYGLTDPDPIYDPSVAKYRIPVVVHVIQNTSGAGFISEAQVQSQIDILNEDFLALPGTNGAPGTDTQVEFYLATVDPQGNPTNGITYSTNNTWYNDGGGYYNTLAWDTNRYLNIYTNTASGALGYVPDLPQGGIAGSNADRVVVLWSSFGRNAPIGPPFNQGRTATHEVGHYLGLYHTFNGGCGSASACYTSGDRICDTNGESSPTSGCPGNKTSCGNPDPVDNYMDYSSDLCMEMFTYEQTLRMRCSLEGYRPDVYDPVNVPCGNGTLDEGEECDDGNRFPLDGCDENCQLELPPTEISGPASVQPFLFTSKSQMVWEDGTSTGSTAFNLYRGTTGSLAGGDYGNCFRSELSGPNSNLPFNPPAGVAWFLLVTGENVFGEGSLGTTSAGESRPISGSCN